jgi:hypothetical protein
MQTILRKSLQLHLQFVSAVGRVAADHIKQFIQVLEQERAGGATEPAGPAHASASAAAPSLPSLLLEGEAGASVAGVFMLENHLPAPVEAKTIASPLRNPAGEARILDFRFDPSSIVLQPGEKALIRVMVSISEDLAPDMPYIGLLSVPEIRGAAVPVEVRRRFVSSS